VAGAVGIDRCNALLEVQRLDLILDELALQESSLPHKTRIAQIAQKMAEGQSFITKLEDGLDKFESQIQQGNTTVEQLREKIAKDQRKLDAGDIDYRQIEAVTADLGAHNERIEHTESEQILLMEAKQSARDRIADYRKKIDELQVAKEQTLKAYRQQMAVLAAKKIQISAARDEKREVTGSELVEQYDLLRKNRGGTVVGVFDGTRCTVCSLTIPTALTESFVNSGDTGICSECKRILVYRGETDDE
jgi:predicted  nucleic acid-binding Zn-ribbon protein